MTNRFFLVAATLGVIAACSSESTKFSSGGRNGTGGSAGSDPGGAGDNGMAGDGASAGSGASSTGGTAGTGGTSTGGASTGGTSTGGTSTGGTSTGGTSTGGTSTGGASTGGAGMSGSAGAAGAPTCPGAAPGCVIDWAGQFGSGNVASQDGVGQAAVFGGNDGLRGITGDGTYIYVAGHNCIRRIAIANATVETFAGQCGTAAHVDARGTAARFGFVDGVVTDGTTLWVADGGNFVIRELDLASGDVTTLTGLVGMNGLTDGDSSTAQFDSMLGMTHDGTHLYLTEGGTSQTVRRIDPSTGDVDTVAGGNGTGGMNGTGAAAQLSGPRKLGTDGTDLFIADTENHQVRRIVLGRGAADTHTVTTFAGSSAGYVDAAGTAAQFRRLRGVTFDGTDFLVSDSDNCVVRKLEFRSGNVTTIAGIQLASGCANHTVGVGTQAEFNKPMDIHFDSRTGDLFIAEGSVLRRMDYR